jgi:hypothetical protein
MAQVRIPQIRMLQIRCRQGCPRQVRAAECGQLEPRILYVCILKIGTGQLRSGQIGAAQGQVGQLGIRQVQPTQVQRRIAVGPGQAAKGEERGPNTSGTKLMLCPGGSPGASMEVGHEGIDGRQPLVRLPPHSL